MKLIEVLVQELPNRGGWPDGVIKISQDYDGEVWCWFGHGYGNVKSLGRINLLADNHRKQSKDEDSSCFVTREQYEDALSASKPEWNGEGLPPVGCECEYETNGYGIKKVRVECITMDGIAFTWLGEDPEFRGLDCINTSQSHRFRPIRSEADKKRDIIIYKIEIAYKDCPHSDAVPQAIYEAIAEHIRID